MRGTRTIARTLSAFVACLLLLLGSVSAQAPSDERGERSKRPPFRGADPALRAGLFEAWKASRGRRDPLHAVPETIRATLATSTVGRPSLVINASGQILFTKQFPPASCDVDPGSCGPPSGSGCTVWAAVTAYPVGKVVRSQTGNTYSVLFQAQNAGTTGAVEPNWPVTAGLTVVDGGITWLAIGFDPAMFTGCTATQLVLRSSGGTETVIAREGSNIGGGQQVIGWGEFYALNDGGVAAFKAPINGILQEGDEGSVALMTAGPGAGSINVIARTNTTIGGLTIGGISPMVAINNAGQVLFDGYSQDLRPGEGPWQVDNSYNNGDFVLPTAGGPLEFRASAACLSGLVEPTWPTRPGLSVADGSCTWDGDLIDGDEQKHNLIRFTPGPGNEFLFGTGTDVGSAVTVTAFGENCGGCQYDNIDGLLNASGHTSTVVTLSNGDTAAYLVTGPLAFTEVARTNGSGPGGLFFGTIHARTALNDSDEVLFLADLNGGTVRTPVRERQRPAPSPAQGFGTTLIRWTAPSTYDAIATEGDDIGVLEDLGPTGETITTIGYFGDINNPGNVVFQATLSSGVRALFYWDGTTGIVSEIAREGANFPARLSPEMVTLNDSNVVAFTSGNSTLDATDEGGELDMQGFHLWTKGGGVQNMIRNGDVIGGQTVSSVNAQHPNFRRRYMNQSNCVAVQYFVGGVTGGATEGAAEGSGSSPQFGGIPPAGQLFASCGVICNQPGAPELGIAPPTQAIGGTATLSWSGTLAVGTGVYKVIRTAGGPPTTIASIPASTVGPFFFVYNVVGPTGTQTFTVQAVPTCDRSLASTSNPVQLIVTGSPSSCVPPGIPSVSIDKSVVNVGDTYTLSWNASLADPADGFYRIEISIGGALFAHLAVTTNTTYTSPPIAFAPGTHVFLIVSAESSCGRSAFSAAVSFVVAAAAQCNPPGVASNVSIAAAGVSPLRPPSPIDYIGVSWLGPVGGTAPRRYGVRINGDPEVLTTFTSLILPPRGSPDPITAFVTPYSCGTLISAEVFAAGNWNPSGSLGVPRQSHTATLLSGGRVLVAGGASTPFGPAIASAELFDPGTGVWSPTANLAAARQSHTATMLSNGKVLVSGGVSGGLAASSVFQRAVTDIPAGAQLSSAELYDPAAGAWSATGDLRTSRALHTATLLTNGKVLVAGGRGGDLLNTAELYDPATGLWTATGPLQTARLGHTATLLPNGKVLVAGGANASGVLSSAELYDPSTGTWTSTGSLGTAREGQTATLLLNGKVLVSGGDGAGAALKSAELYDPAAGTWSATGGLGTARTLHTATLLPGGAVLAAGGSSLLGPSLKSTELYDPAAGTWSAAGNLNGAHGLHTATLLSSGNVLLAGLPDAIGTEQAGPTAQSSTVALFLTPPVASFTISPNPVVGQPVTFTDTSTPQATGWLWIFDDGTTDSRQSPTHVFTRAGTHSVALDASNGAGSQTAVKSFSVSAAAAATASLQLESVAFDASNPVRQRATVTLGPQGSTWLHVKTGETQDTTLFLRFVGTDGALAAERRLVVSPGVEAVYDMAAWGLKGTFSVELVCDRSFSASIVRSGRSGAKEITR